MKYSHGWIVHLDETCLVIFTIELILKLIAYNKDFCRDPWNVFDFLIVAISFVPDCGMFSSLRIFRVLRLFKLISGVRHMRVILTAIIRAIPGIMWSSLLLLLIYYVYGIIGTNLFGARFPEWFGTLGRTMYSLFQIMTLESWSMGLARPVMSVFPYAWLFFVSYILLASFVVMNIVVGIVLNSIGDSFKDTHPSVMKDDDSILRDIEEMRRLNDRIEAKLKKLDKRS